MALTFSLVARSPSCSVGPYPICSRLALREAHNVLHVEGRIGAYTRICRGVVAIAGSLAASVSGRKSQGERRRRLRLWKRCLGEHTALEDFPVHGRCHYWTLSNDLQCLLVYIPVGHDVEESDAVFQLGDGVRVGMCPDKGGLILDDALLYEVDRSKASQRLASGLYGERCLVCTFPKRADKQDWYTDDVDEHFLTQGDKRKALNSANVTHRTFMDVEIDGEAVGRIVVGLWGDLVPRTVENFRCLCTGEKGVGEDSGKPLHYKGTSFHRVIPGFCVQGGEIFENGDGSGGESIYGRTFEDESLAAKFNRRGILAMANEGADTNGSQFVILTNKAEHLNHTCVGFGHVLEGYDVVERIEELGEDDWHPHNRAIIVDCGELPLPERENC